jgi:outer membrane protein OmpA-like peptidoglycan-associated protein
MAHFIAVQVQFPRISYVPLMSLGRTTSSRRALVPIRDGQRTAVVRLFLMRGEPTDRESVPVRELHTFRITGLDRVAAGRPRLSLSAHFDGRRTVSARVEVEGDGVQAARFTVPRSRRRLWAWVTLLLLLLLLAGAAMLLLPKWYGPGEIAAEREALPSGSTASTDRSDRSFDADDAFGMPADDGDADGATTAAPATAAPATAAPATAAPATAEPATAEPATAAPTADAVSPEEDRSDDSPTTSPLPALPTLPLDRVVYFEPNRTYLTGSTREVLDTLLPILRSYPGLTLSLEGHTALFGTEVGRAEISRGRAEGVLAYLVERGWSPETPPEVVWRGSREPVTRDRTQQHLNRRVEILLTGSE